jgi:hypothetical protein
VLLPFVLERDPVAAGPGALLDAPAERVARLEVSVRPVEPRERVA